MRICFLIHEFGAGGAEMTVLNLSNYAVKNGYQIDILLYGNGGNYLVDPKVSIYNLGKLSPKSNFIIRAFNFLIKKFRFFKYINKNKPDAIFCMLYASMPYTYFVSKRIAIITSERSNPEFLKDKKRIKIRNKYFKAADGIVFQTERAKNYYNEMLQGKGVVIHNAIGNEYIKEIPESIERENKICAMGSLKKEKDYPTLLKAFALVLERHNDFTLEIYGTGVLLEEMQSLCKQLNIAENVKFLGVHKDAIIKIAHAKCYVLSSISEGMPNALMEAMAAGLPCVSTDCPNGPGELIKDGVNGLLVPIQSPNKMAEAICKMIEDVQFAEYCSFNAKKIKETHPTDIIYKQYLNYINEVINAKKHII